MEVYFDDFKVQHIKSPVIQSQDYFPFGLAYNTNSQEGSLYNPWKFQGQEHIDELGVNWDSFKFRNHQPDIGRFFNIDPLSEKYYYSSPYAFSENKVTAHIELEGLESVHFTVRPVHGVVGSRRAFSSAEHWSGSGAMTVTVDMTKNQISNSNCEGACGNAKSPTLVTNKDGSISLSGSASFGDYDGSAAFKISITII